MFNRKVLLMALLAVVLLGSFMGGGVELIKKGDGRKQDAEFSMRHKRKPRKQVSAVKPGFDTTTYQASLHSSVNQVTGWTLGTDPNALQATAVDQKPRHGGHKPRTAKDASVPYELAGGAKVIDPAGRLG